MASETDICNLALGELGITKTITSLDERSTEAFACRRVYDLSRDEVLSDFPWPFATRYETLALVEEDPTSEWAYSYRKPVGALSCRRIVTGYNNEAQDQRIPFIIAGDDAGDLILTDQDDAEMEFTWKITNTARFSAKFITALSLNIAAKVASQVTNGDPYKKGERAIAKYQIYISGAEANAVNEEQRPQAPDAESIRARG